VIDGDEPWQGMIDGEELLILHIVSFVAIDRDIEG